MIKAGINENILISKVEISDNEKTKGNLAITLKEAGAVTDTGEAMSAFEELMEEGMAVEASDFDTTIQIFGLKPKKTDGTALTVKQITEDIKKLKNLFIHILGAYQPVKNVKFELLYKDTGIKDAATYERGVTQEAILKKITQNIFIEFITLMKPHLVTEKPVRLLLLRRKDSNFVGFRTKFLSENPMIEPMDIPLDQTKLAFSEYEIKHGLDRPMDKSQADAPGDKAAAGNTSIPDDMTFPDGLDDMPNFGSM